MATKKKTWSYKAGEKGRNRVRVFEDGKTGALLLEFYEEKLGAPPKKKRLTLKHRDRDRAKREADELAASIAQPGQLPKQEITLRTLFDMYLGEVTPSKGASKQAHDRRGAEMFLRFFGARCKPETLSRRDWDKFIGARRKGTLKPAGSTREDQVGNRVIAYDLKLLLSVLNWATVSRDRNGQLLLGDNPLKGLKLPKEENTRRPMVTEEQYQALLRAASSMDWRFGLLLRVVHETGHRIGAVRTLKWSDVDLAGRNIRWRAENDKLNNEHETPLTDDAIETLEEARRHQPGIGDAWVFPSPGDAGKPCSRFLVDGWWDKAEKLLGWDPVKGRGWHSLRRKFATDIGTENAKELCQLGGWKSYNTVLMCYVQPSKERLRETLENRRRYAPTGTD